MSATAILPLPQLVLAALRRSLLLTELTTVNMPNATAAVSGSNWSSILTWVTTNAPQILALVIAIVTLLGGGT